MVVLVEVNQVSVASLAIGNAGGREDPDAGFAEALVNVGQSAQAVVSLNQNSVLGSGEIPAEFGRSL